MNRLIEILPMFICMIIGIVIYSAIDNKLLITYKLADKVDIPDKWKTFVIITALILLDAAIMIILNKYVDSSRMTSRIVNGFLTGFLIIIANKMDKRYKKHFNI